MHLDPLLGWNDDINHRRLVAAPATTSLSAMPKLVVNSAGCQQLIDGRKRSYVIDMIFRESKHFLWLGAAAPADCGTGDALLLQVPSV